MNVSINGILYEDVSWSGSSMTFETNMTLAEIEAAFAPQAGVQLIVYEGEDEVSRYYNKALDSMSVTGSTPRTVTVNFNLTQISGEAEEEIKNSIDVSDGAIADLAEILAELDSLDLAGLADGTRTMQETIDTWFSHTTDIVNFITDLRKEGGILDTIDIRLTALEHEIGIVSIQKNDEEGSEE